jgi:hypothetical protein
VLLPVLGTIVLALVVGGLVVLQQQREARQVAEADAVAQDYLADVAAFRADVVDAIDEAGEDADPGTLRAVVEKAAAAPPELPRVATFGAENSRPYRDAEQVSVTVREPYDRLVRTLAEADVAAAFVEAAREVLELDASKLLGTTFVTSSAPVRTSLIPAFVRARDEFARVEVPEGQDELARTVLAAAQHVIDQATTLADRIDSGQGFSFTYAKQFNAAAEAVEGYATTVEGDVDEALDAVVVP